MKRFLAIAGLALALSFPALAAHHSSSSSGDKKVYVHGYYRKDGTYVAPHYRAASGDGGNAAADGTPHHERCETCPRDSHGRILRSAEARHEFLRMTGYPHGRPGYIVDHIIPLECGGADTPANMQWQTVAEVKAKDATEGNCRR